MTEEMKGTYGFELKDDGVLMVKKSNVLQEFNYVETHMITKPNRVLLNRYLAKKGVKKGNEAELGELLVEAFQWFRDTVLEITAEEVPKYERKAIHFYMDKRSVMDIREILNKDSIINIVLMMYLDKFEKDLLDTEV